jgi:hypothetical protein
VGILLLTVPLQQILCSSDNIEKALVKGLLCGASVPIHVSFACYSFSSPKIKISVKFF